MEDGLPKRTILMMLYAKLGDYDPNYMKEAERIYQEHYCLNGECMPF